MIEREDAIRLSGDGAGLSFEPAADGAAADGAEAAISPFHLLAASLALCTWSVLEGWARHAELSTAGMEVGVAWTFGSDPVRVTEVEMRIAWPELPAPRREAARRAAAQCTVHHTLEHGSRVTTEVATGAGGDE